MKNRTFKIVALALVCTMLIAVFAYNGGEINPIVSQSEDNVLTETTENSVLNDVVINNGVSDKNVTILNAETNNNVIGDNNQVLTVDNTVETQPNNVESSFNTAPKGEYNKGVILVKFEKKYNASALGELEYISAEALFEGSKWYSVKLADDSKTEEAVEYLTKLGKLEKVDYDYVMGVTGPKEDAEKNPNYDNQVNLGLSNIPHGWTQNDKAPGGTPDVVVAVIDTGVDYNHLDLRNNIWVNTAEIAGNGKDDDGNGYIDDINGWDVEIF